MSQTAVAAGGWPFADALHAEWTKLRTLASTGWLLLGVVAFTIAVSAAADAAASCPAVGCQADQAKLSLTGIQVGQAIVVVIAVLAISNEYSTGMIRPMTQPRTVRNLVHSACSSWRKPSRASRAVERYGVTVVMASLLA